MTSAIQLLALPALTALVISFFATPFVIRLAKKWGMIDDPKTHKHPKVIHEYPVPRGGGLAIFIGIVISALLFLPADKHLVGILLGSTVIVILGLLDDKYDLNPHLRLLVQFLAAGIPIMAGVGIAFIKIPVLAEFLSNVHLFKGVILTDPARSIIELSHPQITIFLFGKARNIWILADAFALVWIVFMMNILNMGAKGVDGQLPGVVAIAAITIAILSLKFSADITQWPVIILASITAGAYLGFLPWHFYPQKIMPSFSGSTLAGYLLAILAILATAKVGALIVVLGVPFIDTGYTIMRRIASGKSPFWGDRGHLHHKLLDYGFSKRQVSAIYWLVTAILGVLAINLNTSFKFYTIIGVAILIGGILLWLTYRPNLKNKNL